jgi:putative oxidoreductase
MTSPLSPFAERSYALLRIVSGFLFAFHGMQKIFGLLSEYPQPPVGSQMWIGGILELVCGLAIALGIFAPLAAFVASGMMAVAYFQFHWKFQFDRNFFPAVNQGEPAVVYCFLFLYMACRGPGPWSLAVRRSAD